MAVSYSKVKVKSIIKAKKWQEEWNCHGYTIVSTRPLHSAHSFIITRILITATCLPHLMSIRLHSTSPLKLVQFPQFTVCSRRLNLHVQTPAIRYLPVWYSPVQRRYLSVIWVHSHPSSAPSSPSWFIFSPPATDKRHYHYHQDKLFRLLSFITHLFGSYHVLFFPLFIYQGQCTKYISLTKRCFVPELAEANFHTQSPGRCTQFNTLKHCITKQLSIVI